MSTLPTTSRGPRRAQPGAAPASAALLMAELRQLARDRLLPALPILEQRELVSREVAQFAGRMVQESTAGSHPEGDRLVLEALARAGVAVLVLKGTLLAHTVYEAPGQRLRGDTDLLVAPQQRPAAEQVLADLGLRRSWTLTAKTSDTQDQWQGCLEGRRVVIDLHWQLLNHPAFADRFPFPALWQNRQRLVIAGHEAAGPGPADALLHAALHYYVHHADQERPAQWLLDADLLWRRMDAAAREAVVQRAMALEVAGIVAAFLERTERRFGTGIYAEALATLRQAGRSQWRSRILQIQGRPLAAQLFTLRALSGNRARLDHLRRLMVPGRAYILQKYPGAPSWALPWLYTRRLIEGWRHRRP